MVRGKWDLEYPSYVLLWGIIISHRSNQRKPISGEQGILLISAYENGKWKAYLDLIRCYSSTKMPILDYYVVSVTSHLFPFIGTALVSCWFLSNEDLLR